MRAMQKPPLHPWFDVGDLAPVVELRSADGRTRPITRMAGRTAVVHVAAGPGDPAPAATALAARAGDFAGAGADLYLVRRGGPEAVAGDLIEGIVALADPAGALAHNLHLEKPTTVVFDRASRLAAVLPLDDSSGDGPAGHAAACLALVRDRLPPERFREGPPAQAPGPPVAGWRWGRRPAGPGGTWGTSGQA